MNYNKALEKMCAKCIDYETCGGTGCVDKQILRWSIESAEYLAEIMEVKYKEATDSTEPIETEPIETEATVSKMEKVWRKFKRMVVNDEKENESSGNT